MSPCSTNFVRTQSKGDHDDKRSYLHKIGTRYFTYFEITHPTDRILVFDSAALVTGRMRIIVEGAPRQWETERTAKLRGRVVERKLVTV